MGRSRFKTRLLARELDKGQRGPVRQRVLKPLLETLPGSAPFEELRESSRLFFADLDGRRSGRERAGSDCHRPHAPGARAVARFVAVVFPARVERLRPRRFASGKDSDPAWSF